MAIYDIQFVHVHITLQRTGKLKYKCHFILKLKLCYIIERASWEKRARTCTDRVLRERFIKT